MINNYLVSVVVVAYNAEDTILETLESIKNQSYQNIELVVTDDCSKDKTVGICKKWIDENKGRFVNTQLLTVEKNTGVCANGNRGRFAATGKWLKGIAGDDILLPNCISDFMSYAYNNKNAEIISSFMKVYNNTFEEANCIDAQKAYSKLEIFNADTQTQKIAMANNLLVYAPSVIYTKHLFETVGGFEDTYSFEDYPFFLSALEHGFKIHFLRKATVGYRVHQSLCHSSGQLFKYKFQLDVRKFKKDRCFKYLSKRRINGIKKCWKLQDFFEEHGMNKNNSFYHFMYWKTIALINKIWS